ncbi:MAG: hypothetical protein ACKVHE_34060 [Planctomycetales bacterium]|jgi:hypothetical protein
MSADHDDNRLAVLPGFPNGKGDLTKTGTVERMLRTGQLSDVRFSEIAAAFFQMAKLQSRAVERFVAAHSTGSSK